MRHAIIIPTYGFVTPDESRPGGDGTKARISVAQDLIKKEIVPMHCIVPFPQNVLPTGEELRLIGRVTLAENVAAYVRNLPEFQYANVISMPVSSGTFNDTVASLQRVYQIAGDDCVTVHFVSDWSQLGRLWLIWYTGLSGIPKSWSPVFHKVPNFRTPRDVWTHEPAAYLKCLLLGSRRPSIRE